MQSREPPGVFGRIAKYALTATSLTSGCGTDLLYHLGDRPARGRRLVDFDVVAFDSALSCLPQVDN